MKNILPLCQVKNYYDTGDVEDIKCKPVELVKYASDFYSDLRKCIKTDFTDFIAKCQSGEFEYK